MYFYLAMVGFEPMFIYIYISVLALTALLKLEITVRLSGLHCQFVESH